MSEATSAHPQPRILARAEHPVSRSRISRNALKVLYRLHGSGFTAFLVGGAVRDLMLGRRPKDFDIGTNARPSQVRHLFRNARLIGRRFRLALITFADEVVEVATFRRSPEPPELAEGEDSDVLAPVSESEEYGSPAEDAWRRDFTVNGLFYDIADFSVIDYVGGLGDLDRRVIRTIGDPAARFLEDPVRMMRAVEYAARLEFGIDPPTAEAIAAMPGELRRAAPARIAYELLESLKGGHAQRIFTGLEAHGLLDSVAPEVHASLIRRADGLLYRLLGAGDERLLRGEETSEETLLGLLFLPSFLDALGTQEGRPLAHPDLERLARTLLDPIALRLSFSHFRGHLLRHAFVMLARLTAAPKSSKMVIRTVRHEAFPVAWQLAQILARAAESYAEGVSAWERSVARLQEGRAPVEEAQPAASVARRRRRRRKRRSPAAAAIGAAGATS